MMQAVEEILPNLFKLEIPLPGSPLGSLNSYVVKARDRSLVIDTGLNREECLVAMTNGLAELGVDLARTDFFITHLHVDHFGLVAKLVKDTRRVFLNRPDAELVRPWNGWESTIAFARQHGFPAREVREAIRRHPGFKYGPERIPELSLTKDGDEIPVGDYHFRCVETPGHTDGHTCLFEPDKKLLLAGDHILFDITPHIQCWSDHENPLGSYLSSLDKVLALEIERVLPGHRRQLGQHRERVRELKHHHQRRAEEVLAILEQAPKTAYEVAAEMTWQIACDSWERFPVAQKWFAMGEALAHLRYLEEARNILRVQGQATITFSRAGERR